MKITEALAAEHTVYRGLFDEIERVLPSLATPGEVKTMAAIVERLLSAHANAEKNLAFVALDHVLSHQGALQRFHQDHQEIDERLKQVHAASRPAEARRLLKASLAASREHFRLEEQQLLPLLEQSLKPETLRELGRSWHAERSGARP
jgi:hemerythrin-like domain-containing protein